MLLLQALLISYYAIGCITSTTRSRELRGANVLNFWNKLERLEQTFPR
jgi:hypothetical protein